MTLLGILVGLMILSLMLIVHELGHFLAGKALGFKIISYNIFMGPVLFQRKGKDGVLYCIRLLPIGASVEFAGEGAAEEGLVPEGIDQYDPQDPGVFTNRPRWARALVIAMGPLTNFMTAILAFVILFQMVGVTLPVVGELAPASLAKEAGMQAGDRILRLNGEVIKTALDLRIEEAFGKKGAQSLLLERADGSRLDIVLPEVIEERVRLGISYTPRDDGRIIVSQVDPASNQGKPVLERSDELLEVNGLPITDPAAFSYEAKDLEPRVHLKILRDGKIQQIDMQAQIFQDRQAPGYFLLHQRDFSTALQQALAYPAAVVRSTLRGLGQMFQGQIKPEDGLTGPIGIVSMVGDVVKERISLAEKLTQLLLYFGFISVAVGFTNLLPLPAFDGYHLLILGLEGLRRKDLPKRFKERMAQLGMVLILGLALLVLAFDLLKLFR